MSTGNNKDSTIVSKKRKRVLNGYLHPNKPEIKKFDFFDGGVAEQGQYRMHIAREFVPTLIPFQPPSGSWGCYELVEMGTPSQGTSSYNRVGQKFFLKYIKFKGHISIHISLPFTIRYKLILIKSDRAFTKVDDFFGTCYSNYQYLSTTAPDYAERESYCRHNFYKTFKWATGLAETRTSVMVVSSGTLSPVDYIQRPTKSSTLGQQPSWTYTVPDLLRLGSSEDSQEFQQCSYMPLNVSVQVNDNVVVGLTHFYLMLMTDHGIGVTYPYYSSGAQNYYRANSTYSNSVARFNFFGTCYFTDL